MGEPVGFCDSLAMLEKEERDPNSVAKFSGLQERTVWVVEMASGFNYAEVGSRKWTPAGA